LGGDQLGKYLWAGSVNIWHQILGEEGSGKNFFGKKIGGDGWTKKMGDVDIMRTKATQNTTPPSIREFLAPSHMWTFVGFLNFPINLI